MTCKKCGLTMDKTGAVFTGRRLAWWHQWKCPHCLHTYALRTNDPDPEGGPLMSPRYSKRHYEDIARIIALAHIRVDRDWCDDGIPDHHGLDVLTDEFCRTFAADNGRFTDERFRAACRETG